MTEPIAGIHHVTAIAGDPQRNLDFYTGVLGLRLVKKTVNFADPDTYHFYFGDGEGRPGTLLTFFPWPGARRGSRGAGQATAASFSLPQGSLGWWSEHLERHRVPLEAPSPRFDEEVLAFLDPDGLKVELVAHAGDGPGLPWAGSVVPEEHTLRGFHGVTLTVWNPEPTAEVLVGALGFRPLAEEGNRLRFTTGAGSAGTLVDLVVSPDSPPGRVAAGSIHHVAFRNRDDDDQAAWRERLLRQGLDVTPVRDRQYFHSIYFREPGGVLFELATDPPGFTFDESVEELGTGFKLPPWLEPRRQEIEQTLPAVEVTRPAVV